MLVTLPTPQKVYSGSLLPSESVNWLSLKNMSWQDVTRTKLGNIM